jgi:hypothetical protein
MRLSPRQASERDTFEWRWVMRQRVVIAWEEKKVKMKKKSVLAIPNRSSYQFFCSPCWWVGVIIRGRKKMKLKFLQCSEFTLYVFLGEKKTDAENEFAIWSFPFSYKFNKDQFSTWKKKNRFFVFFCFFERSRCKFHDNFYENCFFCAR